MIKDKPKSLIYLEQQLQQQAKYISFIAENVANAGNSFYDSFYIPKHDMLDKDLFLESSSFVSQANSVSVAIIHHEEAVFVEIDLSDNRIAEEVEINHKNKVEVVPDEEVIAFNNMESGIELVPYKHHAINAQGDTVDLNSTKGSDCQSENLDLIGDDVNVR